MKIRNVVLIALCLCYMEAEATLCDEDFHVVNKACVVCPSGQSNLAGDDPSGQDTSCDTCRITTNQELRDFVDQWITNPSNHPCGEVIGDWEVGRVTDMSYVFCANNQFSECNTIRSDFNADISNWNTASVTTLKDTFYGATSFTGDGVSNWDTSSVTTLELTFYNATSFMGDGISNWDTSNVKDLKGTFADVISFNGNLSRWNTASVVNMYGTFAGTCCSSTSYRSMPSLEKAKSFDWYFLVSFYGVAQQK